MEEEEEDTFDDQIALKTKEFQAKRLSIVKGSILTPILNGLWFETYEPNIDRDKMISQSFCPQCYNHKTTENQSYRLKHVKFRRKKTHHIFKEREKCRICGLTNKKSVQIDRRKQTYRPHNIESSSGGDKMNKSLSHIPHKSIQKHSSQSAATGNKMKNSSQLKKFMTSASTKMQQSPSLQDFLKRL